MNAEETSSVLWPAYVLDREDGGRTVVLNTGDLGEWEVRDVGVSEERDRLMIDLRPWA